MSFAACTTDTVPASDGRPRRTRVLAAGGGQIPWYITLAGSAQACMGSSVRTAAPPGKATRRRCRVRTLYARPHRI
jgi:hypothetical protein